MKLSNSYRFKSLESTSGTQILLHSGTQGGDVHLHPLPRVMVLSFQFMTSNFFLMSSTRNRSNSVNKMRTKLIIRANNTYPKDTHMQRLSRSGSQTKVTLEANR